MEDAGATRFNFPPVKMLACRLKECKKRAGSVSSFWLEDPSGDVLEVGTVWMQGRILEVQTVRGTTLRLTDDTHTFTVCGAEQVPKGKPCLEPGKYVMVMGVVTSCSPEPVLRAVKITDLSQNPLHQRLWTYEVEDLHKNMNYTKT
uniref:RecQ-mediated genome instability protein 2 n=1 Tax=Leptobrachium leishanense TaxID=445787 RepID=A0A8C5MXT2_9ANUR